MSTSLLKTGVLNLFARLTASVVFSVCTLLEYLVLLVWALSSGELIIAHMSAPDVISHTVFGLSMYGLVDMRTYRRSTFICKVAESGRSPVLMSGSFC